MPGRVKTRLAYAVGESGAARLASAMLVDVWSAVKNTPELLGVLAAAEPGPFPLDVPSDRLWLQPPGPLGFRIETILQRGLSSAPVALAIGADSPLVSSTQLTEALRCIEDADAVLGPCEDGGFYLLGVRDCPTGLLDNIDWSCADTCTETEKRLRSQGMRIRLVSASFDVDRVEDLQRLHRALQALPEVVAPQTREWFRESSWSASSFRP